MYSIFSCPDGHIQNCNAIPLGDKIEGFRKWSGSTFMSGPFQSIESVATAWDLT